MDTAILANSGINSLYHPTCHSNLAIPFALVGVADPSVGYGNPSKKETTDYHATLVGLRQPG